MLKTTLVTLVLLCCAAGLTTSATALAPCDGVKQCKIAQCQAARAAKVAQVTSDKQAQCAAEKAARAANVAQVKSPAAPACCTAAKTAQVAQVKSNVDDAAKCAAAKAAKAAKVAQIKSDADCAARCAAARVAKVAQVKSSAAPACCTAAKATKNANTDAAQVKYVAFGCKKTDALAREAAAAYLKAIVQLQKSSGASGCAIEAASKTLAAVISDKMAGAKAQVASVKTVDPVVTTVSLGSVSDCGPDCEKACCAKPGK